jgi:hypothetical protein
MMGSRHHNYGIITTGSLKRKLEVPILDPHYIQSKHCIWLIPHADLILDLLRQALSQGSALNIF